MSSALPTVEERQVQGTQASEALLELEERIRECVTALDKLKNEIKDNRQMFNDSFKNNPTFHDLDSKVKNATTARNEVKKQIIKSPDVALLSQKLEDLKFDKRETEKTLSDLLITYRDNSGATQLELFSGVEVEIVRSAKIVRKRGKRK